MAHFAQLNNQNMVINVIVVNNATVDNLSFPESEPIGVEFCKFLYGIDTFWKQTSYSASFRKNYAGIGYTYDNQKDAFIPPKPYASWLLNEDTCLWESPIPMPLDKKLYIWDETTLSWADKTLVGSN